MGYGYPEDVVQDFIEDYEEEWGVILPFGDALLMMSLFDGLTALLEKYEGSEDDAGWSFGMPSPVHRR
jgi:hypothetical protein